MRVLMAVMLVLIVLLQAKAWFGDLGYVAAAELRAQVAAQRARADELAQRNRLLMAEVVALKQGPAAVESRARRDLGMVKKGETFFLVPETDPAGTHGREPGLPRAAVADGS